MFKKVTMIASVLIAVFLVVGVAMAQNATMKNVTTAQTTETVATPATPTVATPVDVGNKVCPVTGMTIPELGKYTVEYEGKVYNLCSETCKEKFLLDPTTYIAKVNEELAKAKGGDKAEVGEAKEVKEEVPATPAEKEGWFF